MDSTAENLATKTPREFDIIRTCNNPSTFIQWQTACAYAKYLYLQKAYGSCATKCDELLKSQKIHAVHRVFLHFYAGLSHETLAEARGSEHKDFHNQLDSAEQHLSIALQYLPLSPSKSAMPHARQGSYEAFKRELAHQQRSSTESSRPDTDPLSRGNSKSSRTTPPSPGDCEHVSDEPSVSGARSRFNRILLSLKPELESHIKYIQTLRQDISEVVSRVNGNAGNNPELQDTLAKIAVKQRVADGRKRNWKRARFSLIPQPSSRIGEIDESP